MELWFSASPSGRVDRPTQIFTGTASWFGVPRAQVDCFQSGETNSSPPWSTGWWFQIFFSSPILGKSSNLTNMTASRMPIHSWGSKVSLRKEPMKCWPLQIRTWIGYLLYIADYTTQLYRDFDQLTRIPRKTKQYIYLWQWNVTRVLNK